MDNHIDILYKEIQSSELELSKLNSNLEKEISDYDARISSLNNQKEAILKENTTLRISSEIKKICSDLENMINNTNKELKIFQITNDISQEIQYNPESYLDDFGKAYEKIITTMKRIKEITCEKDFLDLYNDINSCSTLLFSYKSKIDDYINYIGGLEKETKDKEITEIDLRINNELLSKNNIIESYKKQADLLINDIEKNISQIDELNGIAKLDDNPHVSEGFSNDMKLLLGYEIIDEKYIDYSKLFNYKRLLPTIKPTYFDYIDSNNKYPYLVLKPKTSEDIDRAKDAFGLIEENIILQFICKFPTNRKIVIIEEGISILNHLSENENLKNIITLARNTDQIKQAIFNVQDPLTKALGQLKNLKGINNIVEYNVEHSENPADNILLIINNYPRGFDNETVSHVNDIITEGGKAGIYTIITTSDENDFKALTYNEEARQKAESLTMKDNAVVFIHEENQLFKLLKGNKIINCFENAKFDFNIRKKQLDLIDYLDSFGQLDKSMQKNLAKIPLESVWDDIPFEESNRRNEFSEVIRIPIGKTKAKVNELVLDTLGTGGDCLVSGAKGSGKSVFLHTLILNACYHYSPEELEVNIFDFKEGVEFNIYQDLLPHVRYLALGVSVEAAMELIDFLEKDMDKKQEIFKKNNSSQNIVQYNDYAKKHNLPIVPRSIVIIDEYQKILTNDYIIDKLENIVRLGRNAGISLILASQTSPTTNISKLASQISHRIAFKNQPNEIENLIEGCGKRVHEIEELKGACFYKLGFDQFKEANVVRVAFSGERPEDRKVYLETIKNKYPNYIVNQLIFGKETKQTILCEDNFDEVDNRLKKMQRNLNKKNSFANGYMYHNLGKYFYTGADCYYELSPRNPLLCVVGEKENTDTVAFRLIHEMLYLHKMNNIIEPQIYYVDLDPSRYDTPIKHLKKKKNEARVNNPATMVLSNISFANNINGFNEVVDYIWNLINYDEESGYTRNDDNYTPIVVFINKAELLSNGDDFDEEIYKNYCTLLEKGKDVSVYFVLLFEEFNVRYDNYNEYKAKDVIITSSANYQQVLENIPGFNDLRSVQIEALKHNKLEESQILLIDDWVPSRVAIPLYDIEQYIESMIKNLYKENG
ncbi:MAG: hypothetical protein K5765_08320 [Clostridia bacterium]|nr:hypothetical protein [Clostridia bacterium]